MGRARSRPEPRPSDPLWYKDAIIYEVHVRAFFDANGDGIGDFAGLTQKLEYLQDLGVNTIWVLPFYASPLRDDGYDIADYRRIHPDYGTMKDFKRFLDEAHARGLRVITELVINHTSDQHAWFQRARTSPRGSAHRDYYVWTDDPELYKDVRIIFRDFEPSNWTWDPVAGQYYWHRFYSHQPDLNFESPRVRKEIFSLVDFWFEMGVDGFRLDAIPYLFEEDGTSSENLPATHAYLKELRAYVDANFADRLLLAEANQWPEDVADYFGDGDECHMAYHFPLMPRLFMATRLEDRYPVTEILEQTPEIPANCQWAIFLRNHDELTLEMVSDEERDYMYRIFAEDQRARINFGIRRRLAPLLGYNRRLMELLNALLFSMHGTPVLYYGDEIAMGDNIYLGDRNGVRTPMQWSADRNAGFSRVNPQRIYLPAIIDPDAHYEAVNVETQQAHPTTFLWWMKRMIALRKRHKAFGRGSMTFVDSNNRKVLSFLREYEDEAILVVANLSRYVQAVELDLGSRTGSTPVELIGQTAFPPVGEQPYFLSLGPHSFYWFRLEPAAVPITPGSAADTHIELRTPDWTDIFAAGRTRSELERVLLSYIPERRWFGSKARRLRQLAIEAAIPLGSRRSGIAVYCVVRTEYFEGEGERYALPLALVSGAEAERVVLESPWAVLAPVSGKHAPEGGLLVDATATTPFPSIVLQAFRRRLEARGNGDVLTFSPRPGLNRLSAGAPVPSVSRGEQSNTTIFYGHALALKLFRRLEAGIHPQVEVETLLAEEGSLSHVPQLLGTVGLTAKGKQAAAGVIEAYIQSECDAWTLAVDELRRDFEELIASRPAAPGVPLTGLITLAAGEPPPELSAWARSFFGLAELLGERLGQLHTVLASSRSTAFAPEPFTPFYQQSLGQGLRARSRRALALLRESRARLGGDAGRLAEEVLAREREIISQMSAVSSWRIEGKRIRCHGDFHLGQVLYTGKDFVIIDFEGEPAKALGERRIKRSPLLDVAGMLRSFNYAAHFVLNAEGDGAFSEQEREFLRPWATAWYTWASASFLKGYLAEAGQSSFLGHDPDEHQRMLSYLLLEKALYELAYEIQNRPAWVHVPLAGILDCLGPEPG